MSINIEIFCDFDGTISKQDTIDLLLERIGNPAWLEFEDQWLKGLIGSKECMAKQIPLIEGGFKNVLKVLEEVQLDETFKSFVDWCDKHKIKLTVVSDGLDRIINYLFFRERIIIKNIISNKLIELPNNKLEMAFPYSQVGCNSGVCKCAIINNTNKVKIAIGDGRSDFCFSGQANLVFAKAKLLNYCQENNIKHYPFSNFNDIKLTLENLYINLPVGLSPDIEPPFRSADLNLNSSKFVL